jgi:hypothetical protein
LYERPRDPKAVREVRQRIDLAARKRAGRTFLPAFRRSSSWYAIA